MNYENKRRLCNEIEACVSDLRGSLSQLSYLVNDPAISGEYSAAVDAMEKLSNKFSANLDAQVDEAKRRGMDKLAALCGHYVLHIGEAIAYEEAKLKSAINNYESIFKDLIENRGYTNEQACKILADSKPDPDLHARKIAVIIEEQHKVEKFMKDFPRHDMTLLEGTRFAGWTLENNPFMNMYPAPDYDSGKPRVTQASEIEKDAYGLLLAAGIQ